VTDSPDPGRPGAARALLPVLADLWSTGWVVDVDEDFDPDAVHGGPDECLPDAFPDEHRVDEAEATFVHDARGGLVHAVATVFDSEAAATEAWSMLADPAFLDCFARSVAGDVTLAAPDELLGPVTTAAGTDERTDRHIGPAASVAAASSRTRHHRAAFAGTDTLGVRPVVLTIAVTGGGRRVVVLAGVNRPGGQLDRGWSALVAATEARVAAPD
jgi:hypothetical protein